MKASQLFELRKRICNPDILFGIKDYTLNDGPAKGVRAFDVKNGQGLELTVLPDRGLDIPFLTYKGMPMCFASKAGIHAPALYREDGVRGFLTRFNAGMLTTCGITYAGAPCEDEGRVLGLHGSFDNTPASAVCAGTVTEGDELQLKIKGQIKESCVFFENLCDARELTIETESNVVHIKDTLTNNGFAKQPVMLLYHINFGYPMLDAGAKLYFGSNTVTPRDDWAAKGPGKYDVMEAPEVGRDEQCYFHTDHRGDEGFAMIHNEELGIAAIVSFDAKRFPLLCEWKCMMAGDYALGLEPTVAGVMGRAYARAHDMLPYIEPGETITYNTKLIFTEDNAVIDAYKARAKR